MKTFGDTKMYVLTDFADLWGIGGLTAARRIKEHGPAPTTRVGMSDIWTEDQFLQEKAKVEGRAPVSAARRGRRAA